MPQNRDDILLSHQFETIFSGYYSAVKYFALMLLKSEADAEDKEETTQTNDDNTENEEGEGKE